MAGFAAQVGAWATTADGALTAVFRESAQELVSQMDQLLVGMVYEAPPAPGYKRTGFLRASLMASKEAMPALSRENPGKPVPADLGDVVLVINGADVGDTIYLGFTANYAAYVHYGVAGFGMYGHIGATVPRPWVALVAQRWQEIVAAKSAEVKKRLNL